MTKKLLILLLTLGVVFAARPLTTDDPGTQPGDTYGFEYNYNNIDTHTFTFKRGMSDIWEIDLNISHKTDGSKFPCDMSVLNKYRFADKVGGMVDMGLALNLGKDKDGDSSAQLIWLNTASLDNLQFNLNWGYEAGNQSWSSGLAIDAHIIPGLFDIVAEYRSDEGAKSYLAGSRYFLGNILWDLSFTFDPDSDPTYKSTAFGLTYNF